uniref:Si:ch211-218o21.4 n=1 Tax=Sinocyclocheilus anshuiensis TaxID=1608454 RepID=A0A671R3F8_9TELE
LVTLFAFVDDPNAQFPSMQQELWLRALLDTQVYKCDIAEGPWNLNNPVKASRSHQELHKELLLAHKKGLVVCCKPELQMVLERRKREQTQREEGEQSRSPLEQVLQERQSKHQEMMEQRLHEEVQLLEFVRVRQNLRKVHTALQKNLHS